MIHSFQSFGKSEEKKNYKKEEKSNLFKLLKRYFRLPEILEYRKTSSKA